MNKLTEDLSVLTTIDKNKLEHLVKLALLCISEEFTETRLSEKNIMEYDIGIGTLLIGTKDGELKYKFIPSDNLKASLNNILKGKRNSLEAKVEKSLISSIESTYKDLL